MARRSLALLCFVAALVCGEGAGWLMTDTAGDPDRLLWAGLAAQGMWVLLALAGALVWRGAPVGERLGLGAGALPLVGAVVLAVGFVAFSNALHQLLVALELRRTGTLGRIDEVMAAARGPSIALMIVAVGIAPGIGEELLFRGLLQRGLARRLRPVLAIGCASALFGLAHADPVHSSVAFAMGLYLGVAVQLSGSVWPAVACHVLNNMLGVAQAVVARGLFEVERDGLIAALLAAAGGALAFAVRARRRAADAGGSA